MQFKYLDQSLKTKWEDLTKKNSAAGYMQSFFWSEFKNTLGWETFKIGIFEKNKLIGGAVVSKYSHYKNKSVLYIPEGPVLPFDAVEAETIFHQLIGEIDKVANLKGEKLTSHLRIEPKLTKLPVYFNRFQKAPVNQQPLNTLVIDLSVSENEILTQMKPKGRYNIKVARKYGIEVFTVKPQEGLKVFLQLYNKTLERNNFEGKNKDYFERLIYVLSSQADLGEFFFAKHNNSILSSALVIYYGDIATFLFGASSGSSREMMSPYLLHFEIIKKSKQRGLKWYDLYGISPEEKDTSHPWFGFTAFKRKLGGEQINYIGAYDFIYNQQLYKEYLEESGEI